MNFTFCLIPFFLILSACGKSDQSASNTSGSIQFQKDFPYKAVLLERDSQYSVGQVNLLSVSENLEKYDYKKNFYNSISDISAQCDLQSLYIIERFNHDSLAKFSWHDSWISKIPNWQISTYSESEDGQNGEGIKSSNPVQVVNVSERYSVLLRYNSRFLWILDNNSKQGRTVRSGRIDLKSSFFNGDPDGVPEVSSGILVGHILYLVLSHLDRFKSPWGVNLPATLIGLDVDDNFRPTTTQVLPFKNVAAEIKHKGNYLYVAGVDLMFSPDSQHPEVANDARDAGLVRFNVETKFLEPLIDRTKISSFEVVGDLIVFTEYAYLDRKNLKIYSILNKTTTLFDSSVNPENLETMTAGPESSLWLGIGGSSPRWLVYQLRSSEFNLIKSIPSQLIPMGIKFCF
jgi:hypothetical protein